jgi:hypothetical protein
MKTDGRIPGGSAGVQLNDVDHRNNRSFRLMGAIIREESLNS